MNLRQKLLLLGGSGSATILIADFGYLTNVTPGLGDALKHNYPDFGPGTQQFS